MNLHERAQKLNQEKKEKPIETEATMTDVGAVTQTTLGSYGEFVYIYARSEGGEKEVQHRWIARRYRPEKDLVTYRCTEVVVSSAKESFITYSYAADKSKNKRISGMFPPDPVPFDVVMALMGFRDALIDPNAPKICLPGSPEFAKTINRVGGAK